MKTEELTALGLNDEQVKGVFKLHGTAITALQNELGAANNTIKGLRDAAKKFEGVDVDKLQGDLEALQNKYDADVGAARLSGAMYQRQRGCNLIRQRRDAGHLRSQPQLCGVHH